MNETALNSRFFTGTVVHGRKDPVEHSFSYPVAWYALDVDEASRLDYTVGGFSYNKFCLASIYDHDYLQKSGGSIRIKIERILKERNITTHPCRIMLITTPRILGYVFNPVSFYYLYDQQGDVFCYFAEVNNTYEERTLYVFDVKDAVSNENGTHRFKVAKHFHVSPFYDETGHYDVSFSPITDSLDIKFNLHREDEKPFVARMWGTGVPFHQNHRTQIFRYALRMSMTLPRIYWQAMKLLFAKKLPINKKPNPLIPLETKHMTTLRAEPYKWFDQVCMRLVKPVLRKLKVGQLRFVYPDGETEYYGDASSAYIGEIHIRNFSFFWKLIHSGGIGFGESFVDGDWTTPDLARVMKVILDNDRHMHESKFNLLFPVRWFHRVSHWWRKNSKKNSQQNISDHYDLGNDMFSLFLDQTMAYSSGVYRSANDSLHDAQLNKLHAILKKAQVKPGDSILEIGCGWGELAAIAAKEYGATVTGITLSTEQSELAKQKMVERNVEGQVQVQIRDYRDVQGVYDKVISVEMIEAVGKEYLGSFFHTIDRVLSPDGICVLQIIAYPDSYYKEYLGRQDWIQKHIFPGSHLPSLQSITEAMAKNACLVIDSIENRSADYARTLKEWRIRFNERHQELQKAGYDDRFQRAWNFYLASCEAEFETRWLSLYQVVLTRPNNRTFNEVTITDEVKEEKTSPEYMH